MEMAYIIFSVLTCIAVVAVAINFVENFKRGKEKEISFKESLHLTGMPIITMDQGKKHFNFLLDTGSNCNHINSILVDNGSVKIEKEEKSCSVFGMEGTTKETGSGIMTITLNGVTFTDSFMIHDLTGPFGAIKEESGVTIHGVLGTTFFEKYKYVIDFNKYIAHSNGKRN